MALEDILLLIPQRPPFVMVDLLLSSDENNSQTSFLITEENVLVENGEFSEAGLMENIAQTAAAGAGYLVLRENKVISVGYIVAVKNLEIFDLPKINDELITDAKIVTRVFDMSVISGTVKCNGKIMAQCEMNIYVRKTTGVFIVADNIISPLGSTTAENFTKVKNGVSGIREHHDIALADQPFYASLFDHKSDFILGNGHQYTKFEQLLITSIQDALQNSNIDAGDKKTVLIISSTKGNISLLETEGSSPALQKRIALPASAKLVAEYFGFINQPVVVSNACISGMMAIITGMRLIQNGQYEHAVIAGADVISKFILSGFQAFQAISPAPCKPFDLNRGGISLGEGAATVILSSVNQKNGQGIKVAGGAVSNDANHISAPSRTGEELNQAIEKALKEANLAATDIDLISAHGTATMYNDEMEAKAIALAKLDTVPVNSLKGYYGHTLGAAGLIESIISIHSLKENLVIPTLGFKEMGVTDPINICTDLLPGDFKNCLKTASGFGGCNAAVIFSKQ